MKRAWIGAVVTALVTMGSACGSSARTSPPLYDVKATAACLKQRPEYHYPYGAQNHLGIVLDGPYQPHNGIKGAWNLSIMFFPPDLIGSGRADLHVYPNEADAQRANKLAVTPLRPAYRQLKRNVFIIWTSRATERFSGIVFGCLRA